ncbi:MULTISPECIES: YhgE/Pip domain-containing protein [unclassified Luteococcus]|uniref:YhgE/Pip domain-containing protein n=1 Tax=unclassified Luteococcus TaxID=2639923 RepID=UPI00313C866C
MLLPSFRPELVNSHRPLGRRSLLALVLVPLLLAGVLLGAAWGRDHRLDKITAAVVNADKAVTINGQQVPMGRQLSAEIVAKQSRNITWVLSDPADAAAGLADGRYAAVVTIPENFSAAATSVKAAEGAQQATIDVQTSPAAPVKDSEIARQVADLAAQSTNAMLTGNYLKNIYVGFNTMGKQLTTIGNGATQLADGAEQLDDGAAQAAKGTGELGKGMAQLTDAGTQLATGGQQVITGGNQLAQGGTQLSTGGKTLASGATQLSAGGKRLTEGGGQLVAGGKKLTGAGAGLDSGASQLSSGISQYTKGTGQVVDGIGQLAGGINRLEAGLAQGTGAGNAQFAQLGQLKTGAQQVAGGAAGLSSGLTRYQDQLVAWRDGKAPIPQQVSDAYTKQFGAQCSAQIADGMRTALSPQNLAKYQATLQQQLATSLDQLPPELALTAEQKKTILAKAQLPQNQQLTQLVADSALADKVAAAACPQVAKAARPAFEGGFQAGAGTAAAALEVKDPKTGQSLKSGAAALADGAGQLSSGVTRLVDQLPKQIAGQLAQLTAGVKQLSDGADTLASKSAQLKTGGTKLATGAAQLSTGVDQYTDGVADYTQGVGGFAQGVDRYAAGANTLAAGVGKYTTGVGAYLDGVGKYTDGVATYADGVTRYTVGVKQANDGVQQLATGITKLSGGADKLATGTRTFADKVSDGAQQVPSYSAAEREKLSTVVATPVTGGADSIATPLKQITTLVLTLGTWLGALATWLLVRPVASRTLTSSRPSWQLAAATMVPGATVAAGQAVLLGILGSTAMHLGFGRGVELTAFLVLAALAFTAVNHALAAWFGGLGRTLAAVLAAVTAAVGLVSAVPSGFAAVHGASPLAPALTGLRRIVTGAPMGVGPVGLLLTFWLLAAVAGLLAVTRRRTLSPAGYRRAAGQTRD